MNNIAKIGLLIGGAIVGMIALFIGNTGSSNSTPAINFPTNNGNPTTNTTPTIVPNKELPKSTFDYLPTQYLGDKIVQHNYFSLSYSNKHQNAEWVAYELQGARIDLENAVERAHFIADPAFNTEASAQDYSGSGYDRGHLAPAFDMNFNALAMKECFYMSNISPQVPEFNRGIWKELESQTRKWAQKFKRVYVITGPILRHDPKEALRLKGKANLPTIPRGYYKVILDYDGEEKKGIAFLFKNKKIDQPLENFVVSIDRVEAYTNLDFFPKLSEAEQQQLEAVADLDQWGF